MARVKPYWTVPQEWAGETAVIVAGGPSVGDLDLALLAGQRVIAVNSSYAVCPAADFLIFGDTRWWAAHRKRLCAPRSGEGANRFGDPGAFAGRIVSTAEGAGGDPVKKLRKVEPGKHAGLSPDRQALAMRRTTLTAALNLCLHLGVARILLLGADMQAAPGGRSHHHAPHPWPVKPGCWDEQMVELEWAAAALARAGIAVVNCSPHSRIGWWERLSLPHALAQAPTALGTPEALP